MTHIILAGGGGTRLWPISRTFLPKQFMQINNKASLFQNTIQRNRQLCDKKIIVLNQEHYFLALDQIGSELEKCCFLVEPIGRNTAAAIALACLTLELNEIVLVSPSDHIICDVPNYTKAVLDAAELAKNNKIVTFGVKPTSPECGYGYIKTRQQDIISFCEKPDLITATNYIESGDYLWNSGIFCFKVDIFLSELAKYRPDIYQACLTTHKHTVQKYNIIKPSMQDMLNIPEESIDYAVLEKSNQLKTVLLDAGWSDLGSFESLDKTFKRDKNGNTASKNLITIDSVNNFVLANNKTVSLVDISNLIIVDTLDALLIANKGSGQKIKEIVSTLKKTNKDICDTHTTTYRPWGTYTILENSDKYKIKKLIVKPKKRLSLQKHIHRSEHWVVVSGRALVTIGDKQTFICANESTYIPATEMHRLENPDETNLVMIEVQVGDYVGEDDILRLEDDFQRI